MNKYKLVISIIEIICGIVFLLNSASDIQLGFGIVLLLSGIKTLK